MRNSNPITLAIVLVLSIGATFAAIIPGRWDKVDNLVPGTQITIEMQSGDEIHGEFVSSATDALSVDVPGQNRMTVPKNGVFRILMQTTVKRQTLLGTLIGAGGGVATGLLISSRFDETFFARGDLMGITCGGIGALTGALIGRAIKSGGHEEILYQSR